MTAGIIIAGGRSTRFGDEDKAIADLGGVPMIRRVADRIEGVVDELVVNCRTEQTDSLAAALRGYGQPVQFAEDENPDRGPMAGILSGLRAVDATYAFVVACDMPFVDPALVEHLFERASGRDADELRSSMSESETRERRSDAVASESRETEFHDAAVPQLDDQWFQTTHAVYRAEPMAEACVAALERGEHKIIEALFELDYVVVTEDEVREYVSLDSFENVNTREEFEAAEARL